MNSRQKLIIAIDYGTTNTGVAYALVPAGSDDQADIQVIRKWPHGALSRDASDKVPSDIAYDEGKQPVGYGFEIPEGVVPLQWVKLLLYEDERFGRVQKTPNTERVWRAYAEIDRLGKKKKPTDVIADYLRWLWGQIRDLILELEDGVDVFSSSEVILVLTVPACWSDRAKNCIRQAAQNAGIDSDGATLKFQTEPEAAAVFGLKARAKRKQLSAGDCVIILDAGGGTVDVVTYQVCCPHPLVLDQKAVSMGELCGSAFVDAEFESQLRSILSSDLDRMGPHGLEQIRDEFEYKIKRTYDPEKPREYSVPVIGMADDPARGIKNGRLKLEDAVIRASFETVMTQISTLIDRQRDELAAKHLDGNLKGILLVGGFGGSDYLHTRIRQEYPEDDIIKIWRGDQSWTAVAQGAVACELAAQNAQAPVQTRLASCNYGVPYRERSTRKVQWLVRKGQAVQYLDHTEPYALKMEHQDWLDEDKYAIILVPLVRTTDDTPSEDLDPDTPTYVEMSCRVSTAIRKEGTLIQKNPKIWQIPAELVLEIDGAVLAVSCRIKGRHVGSAKLKYYDEADTQSGPSSAASSVSAARRPTEESVAEKITTIDTDDAITRLEPQDSNKPITPNTDRKAFFLPFRKQSRRASSSTEDQTKSKAKLRAPTTGLCRDTVTLRDGTVKLVDTLGRLHDPPPKYAEHPGLF